MEVAAKTESGAAVPAVLVAAGAQQALLAPRGNRARALAGEVERRAGPAEPPRRGVPRPRRCLLGPEGAEVVARAKDTEAGQRAAGDE